jgi:hypothetical protein
VSADPAVLERVRAIADAVLYEGYLLYPYRASSSKNQSRWQFGVLGPPRAAAESFAESPRMEMQCLLEPSGAADAGRPDPNVVVRLRFLQLQTRTVQQLAEGQHVPVGELLVNGRSLLSWEEAVECEELLPSYELAGVFEGGSGPLVETVIDIPGGEDVEEIVDASGAAVGRIVRRRVPLPRRAACGSPSLCRTRIPTLRPARTMRSACR